MPLLKEVRVSLFEVIDPELGVNIMDLGLIYGVFINEDNSVIVKMTLTTPGCPMADSITKSVSRRISRIENVTDVTVDLVFEPRWTPDKMTDRCKAFLSK